MGQQTHVHAACIARPTTRKLPSVTEKGALKTATVKLREDEFSAPLRMQSPRVDFVTSIERVWSHIHSTADWGRLPDNPDGISRLALTDEDQCVRRWFVDQAEALGCDVKVDEMGNIFAILAGEARNVPPIGIGSHLDTQPRGGRFDGILGVVAGLEVVRAIKHSHNRNFAPIAVINWTNEEGARHVSGCTGSAVWSHHVSLSKGHSNRALDGATTLCSDLQRIDFLGTIPASHLQNPLSAHFELHIEQGTRLERANKKIGSVSAVQGIRWYTAKVRGKQEHAGSTPVVQRADAVVAMSKFVVYLEELAVQRGVYATVGIVGVENGSSNVVSGSACFTVDLRHPDEALLDEIERAIHAKIECIHKASNGRLCFELEKVWHSPAVNFDTGAVDCVKNAARCVVGAAGVMDDMISYAGHDSALVASAKVPTAMIFVPSKDGVSHSPDEWTSKEDCKVGVETLYHAVLAYDDGLRLAET